MVIRMSFISLCLLAPRTPGVGGGPAFRGAGGFRRKATRRFPAGPSAVRLAPERETEIIDPSQLPPPSGPVMAGASDEEIVLGMPAPAAKSMERQSMEPDGDVSVYGARGRAEDALPDEGRQGRLSGAR